MNKSVGSFAFPTHTRILETVTGMALPTSSSLPLAIGVSGFVGTTFFLAVSKTWPCRQVTFIVLFMIAVALAMVAFGGAAARVFVMLAVWGSAVTGLPVG